MSSLTEVIESYINELFQQEEQDGSADADRVSLRRKDVAERFGCVPSQINYVLRSRFTPERGYIVESQRGGNGYIRILKISYDMPEERAQHIDRIVGDSITEADALIESYGLFDQDEVSAVSNRQREDHTVFVPVSVGGFYPKFSLVSVISGAPDVAFFLQLVQTIGRIGSGQFGIP